MGSLCDKCKYVLYEGSPRVFLTILFAILLNSSLFSLHMIAASTLAPLSSLGSEIKGYLIQCQSSSLLTTNKSTHQPTSRRHLKGSSPHSARDSIVQRTVHSPWDHLQVRAGSKCRLDHRQILKRRNLFILIRTTTID